MAIPELMSGMVLTAHGGPDCLEWRTDLPVPVPAPGEVLIEESLRQLEDDFAPLFVRIHRKALVAKRYITGLERSREGHHWVRLQHCPEPLPVSRRRLAEVRRVLSDEGGDGALDHLDDA